MIRRLALALPLLAALALLAAPAVSRADEIGAEDIVVSGLKRSVLADHCKVKLLTKSGADWKTSKVWVVEVDRRLYVLSSKGGWYERAKASPDVVLRVGDDDYAVSARDVEDPALREVVHAGLKEKCGCCYRLRSFFCFWCDNHVMKIVPRPPGH